MKEIILAALIGASGSHQDAVKPSRGPASVDHQTRGGCLMGINGALQKMGKSGKVSMEIIGNECDRLVGLSGPYQEAKTPQDKYMHGCGLGYGAMMSGLIGKQKFTEKLSNGEIETEMKEICLKNS